MRDPPRADSDPQGDEVERTMEDVWPVISSVQFKKRQASAVGF